MGGFIEQLGKAEGLDPRTMHKNTRLLSIRTGPPANGRASITAMFLSSGNDRLGYAHYRRFGASRECRHIHRHSRESGNPKAIGSKCVFASYRIPGSRFRGDDGNRRLETDILKLTTLPRECRHIHRHSRESGNPKAIGSKCVLASYRILGSRFRGNDGNRR